MSKQSEVDKWWLVGQSHGWKMPAQASWKRLPIIRHVLTIYLLVRVEVHYSRVIGFRTGYDEWVMWGLWRGLTEDAK